MEKERWRESEKGERERKSLGGRERPGRTEEGERHPQRQREESRGQGCGQQTALPASCLLPLGLHHPTVPELGSLHFSCPLYCLTLPRLPDSLSLCARFTPPQRLPFQAGEFSGSQARGDIRRHHPPGALPPPWGSESCSSAPLKHASNQSPPSCQQYSPG